MFVYVCIDVHIYVCMNVYQCVYLHLYAYNYVYVCSGFTDILATLQKHNDSYKVSHMELYGQFLWVEDKGRKFSLSGMLKNDTRIA